MQPGFCNNVLQVETGDGENFKLLKPLFYCRRDGTMLMVLPGATTDGPSIPHWTGIPRTGLKWFPGVLHDAAYRLMLQKKDSDDVWIPCILSKDESDLLFKEALEVNGVPFVEAMTFYLAVKQCGQKAFNEDRGLVQ